MSDKIYRPFSELDFSDLDFSKSNWSWGYDIDSDKGEIRDINGDGYEIAYIIPDSIVEIIKDISNHKVYRIKKELVDLERKKQLLLDIY